jgi:hypothetical protein
VTSPLIQHIYFGSPQSHTFVSRRRLRRATR